MGELDRIARAFGCHEPSMTLPLSMSRPRKVKLTHYQLSGWEVILPKSNLRRPPCPWDNEVMDNVTFETQDLRVRIEDKVARIDQRKLSGETWKEIDQSTLPIPEQWFASPIRTSPLKVALLAFERENPGDMTLRIALRS
jgi:hypothetical protein